MDSIDVVLGAGADLLPLFSTGTDAKLTDLLSHAFNQTLQRDMFFGSWADAYLHEKDGLYHVKLTSPSHDLQRYKQTIPAMLEAGRIALETFRNGGMETSKLRFYLPFGLAMSSYKSVQMLHFPPSEAREFIDYLYNPTCRRWELLLLHNGFDGRENTRVERLIDLVPIAAPGGDSKEIDTYNDSFVGYVQSMLTLFLGANADESLTAPLVVGGAPAYHCVNKLYKKDEQLGVMSLVDVEIVGGKKTWLLCTNHPSTYLYVAFGEHADEEQAMKVMREDLICAGWQGAMAQDWHADPWRVLDEMKERWASDAKVKKIMDESAPEWRFDN